MHEFATTRVVSVEIKTELTPAAGCPKIFEVRIKIPMMKIRADTIMLKDLINIIFHFISFPFIPKKSRDLR